MHGTIVVTDRGPVRVHTYVAPDDSLNVTTQLIETPGRLVAVDGQYALACADEVVAYAKSLGKPLDRLVVTHAHPDHFQGARRFGAPVHALAAVREQIVAQGDGRDPSGAIIPVADVTPDVEVTPGVQAVDGVPFVFEAVTGAEAADQLVIRLPEQGILVAQDLIYHHIHLFLGNNDISGWRTAVEKLASEQEYDVILAGHGAPADRDVFAAMADYLAAAAELLGDDGDAYKKAVLRRFPTYGGAFLIDIANRYLFA